MPMKSAIYIRVSTDEQAREGVSIAAQERQCREYAKAHKLNIASIYCDEGITSTIPLADRPAGRALTEQVLAGNVNHVITYSLSRMFRNDYEAIGVAIAWEKLNVTMHMLDMGGKIDRSTPGGELMYSILATVASIERKQTTSRTSAALRHIAATGRKPNGTAYGYDIGEGGHLVINPAEAEIVKEIFHRALSGEKKQYIAQDLNARGVPLKRSGPYWRDSMINKILHNPIYMGQFRYSGELWPGTHTPIIDKEVWSRMQEQFMTYSRYSPTGRRPATYSGLLRCGHCGGRVMRTVTRNSSGVYHHYRCHSRATAPVPHTPLTVPEGALLDLIWGDVARTLQNVQIGPSIEAAQARDFAMTNEMSPTSRIAEIETALEGLTIARLRNAQAYQAGAITMADLVLLNEPLLAQEDRLQKEKSSAIKMPEQTSLGDFDFGDIAELIRGLREDCEITQQLEFLRRLYIKFEIFNTHVLVYTHTLEKPYKLQMASKRAQRA